MFNHSTLHQNVGWERDVARGVVVYKALRDIGVGEELCQSSFRLSGVIPFHIPLLYPLLSSLFRIYTNSSKHSFHRKNRRLKRPNTQVSHMVIDCGSKIWMQQVSTTMTRKITSVIYRLIHDYIDSKSVFCSWRSPIASPHETFESISVLSFPLHYNTRPYHIVYLR